MMDHGSQTQPTPLEKRPAVLTDRPGRHGMLMFGEGAVYFSHLPMFMSPHDYQAIFAVTLTLQGSDPQAAYVQDRRTSGQRIYTFVPERFVLPDLVTPDRQHPRRTSFMGTPFRGHFERGGQPLPLPTAGQLAATKPPEVKAAVDRIIHFRKFSPEGPPLPQLEYLLFGKGTECFLAHFITTPPDFDQILAVKVAGRDFTAQELQQGVLITLPRPRECACCTDHGGRKGASNSPERRDNLSQIFRRKPRGGNRILL